MASNSVNGAQDEPPLLRAPAGAAAATFDSGARGFLWLKVLGFGLLTFNSGVAMYRSRGDMCEVAFVVFAYANLVSLFLCLRRLERAKQGSMTRRILKAAVWVLTSSLTLLFASKVAAIMPVVVQILVWVIAFATILGGFFAFFIHEDRKGEDDAFGAALTNERVMKIRRGRVLDALRSRSIRTAISNHAQDPRDVAWSGARLIVDSGATMHAVGNVWLLEDFQRYTPPLLATLADGSHLRILGIGRIQRGNFRIPNVYLVEGVQDGLISTPYLDTHHALISCFGNGVCRIMKADGTEVGGAILEEDGSYVLRFLEVP